MPTVVTELPGPVEWRRKLWTRAEVDRLSSETGLFERLELIEGELFDKSGQKPPHAFSAHRLWEWLAQIFGLHFVQHSVTINVSPEDNPTCLPEPDLTVLNRDFLDFAVTRPCPQDIRLVIEVSDSTLIFDLRTKAALYARAGIVEYWVLDLGGRRMIVHRDPRDGHYTSVVAYSAEESVATLAAPESPLRVSDALG